MAVVIFSYSYLPAQDNAAFYTENGSKAVAGELDCAALNDLMVKAPVSSNAIKYDQIVFTIELKTNEKIPGTSRDEIFYYGIYLLQKKFSIQYEGKTEATLWLAKPNDGAGDFLYSDNVKLSKSDLCGMTTKEKIEIKFLMTGFIQTGEKEFYNESTSTWEKQPTYDEGTVLSEANVVIKQTPENIQAAKKAKRKKSLGF